MQALEAAQDVLCAAPGTLGRMEGTTVEASDSELGHSEEETSDGSQPYVPEWVHVTRGSNLATSEVKLEWL